MKVHFGAFDPRSCKPRKVEAERYLNSGTVRQITLDPNAVTCERCKANDTLTLSPAAAEYVRDLERKSRELGIEREMGFYDDTN